MSIQDQLNKLNSMKQCHSVENVKWVPIKKTDTPPRQPRGRGELPYQMEICNSNSSGSSQNIPSNKRYFKNKKTNKKMNEPSNRHQFAHITPNVREASGGWNTQSNEAIERRMKERKEKFAEENMNSGDSCNVTSSSESSASYKTTLQDSYELKAYGERVTSNEEVTSETLTITNLQRYKKNALMLGLIRSAEYTDVERNDTTASSSEEYYESNSFDDVASEITNLNLDHENVLQSERIGRFFQSQEDEDVYCHPLREQIQKNPDWQKHRLKRKGTETVLSPRQYFLNIDDDEFAFEPRKRK